MVMGMEFGTIRMCESGSLSSLEAGEGAWSVR